MFSDFVVVVGTFISAFTLASGRNSLLGTTSSSWHMFTAFVNTSLSNRSRIRAVLRTPLIAALKFKCKNMRNINVQFRNKKKSGLSHKILWPVTSVKVSNCFILAVHLNAMGYMGNVTTMSKEKLAPFN